MTDDGPLILGIESSCDETAAAVVRDRHPVVKVLSNIIATQHDLHAQYAGVVPEIASRAHLERMLPVIREALVTAGVTYDDIDAIAVGNQPGLIGSLLVGVSAAKSLAWSKQLPLIGIDHIHAHLYAGVLDAESPTFPALGLVVSGGHTSLYFMKSPLEVRLIGHTIDDAVGEAYDKAATILQLGYPGGPRLDKLAQLGNDETHKLPITLLDKNSLNFSFSGLKTALLYAVCGQPQGRGSQAKLPHDASQLTEMEKADFAASFQKAAITAIMTKVRRALKQHKVRALLTGGGVTANSRLRKELTGLANAQQLDLRLPRVEFCLDNAAMIAGLAAERYRVELFDDLSLAASPRCV